MPGRGQQPWNKRFVDESAFDDLDERKAAILGLLFADGCVSPMGRAHSPALRLALRESRPVYMLREILQSTHAIVKTQQSCQGNRPCAPSFSLSLCGLSHLADRIHQLGLTHPKATRIPMLIPTELEHHFIRGYFEGDGSVWWNKVSTRNCRGRVNSNIAAHPLMATWLSIRLRSQGILGSCSPTSGCLRLTFGKRASGLLYHLLYDDATIVLIPDKEDKFKQQLIACGGY